MWSHKRSPITRHSSGEHVDGQSPCEPHEACLIVKPTLYASVSSNQRPAVLLPPAPCLDRDWCQARCESRLSVFVPRRSTNDLGALMYIIVIVRFSYASHQISVRQPTARPVRFSNSCTCFRCCLAISVTLPTCGRLPLSVGVASCYTLPSSSDAARVLPSQPVSMWLMQAICRPASPHSYRSWAVSGGHTRLAGVGSLGSGRGHQSRLTHRCVGVRVARVSPTMIMSVGRLGYVRM